MRQKFFNFVIVLMALMGAGIMVYHYVAIWYETNYEESYRWTLSERLEVIEYNNGKAAIFNKLSQQIVGQAYDSVFDTEAYTLEGAPHEVFVVVKDGLRGYISANTGEQLVKPQFEYAWIDDPESHLAACVNESGKLGFINVRTKEIVIPFQFDHHEEWYDYVFHNGVCRVTQRTCDDNEYLYDEKHGVIDTLGRTIIPCVYDDIHFIQDSDFKEYKYIAVCSEEKHGIMDMEGNEILPCAYEEIEEDEDCGLIKVCKDEKFGLCDPSYNEVFPTVYSYIEFYKDGIVFCKDDGSAVLYDITGKILISRFYSEYIEPMYEVKSRDIGDNYTSETSERSGYYLFHLPNGKVGVVTRDQKIIIPALYSNIEYIGDDLFNCTIEQDDDEYVRTFNAKGERLYKTNR